MYSFKDLKKEKEKNKKKLLGTALVRGTKTRVPLLYIESLEIADKEEAADFVNGLMELGLHIVLANGLLKKAPAGIHLVQKAQRAEAFAGCDLALIETVDQLHSAWKQGCVPISILHAEATVNYTPLAEQGNGFYFASWTKWRVYAAVVRALETYQFPYDWENIVKEIAR